MPSPLRIDGDLLLTRTDWTEHKSPFGAPLPQFALFDCDMRHYDKLESLRLASSSLFVVTAVHIGATGADEAWIPGQPFPNCFAPERLRCRPPGKQLFGPLRAGTVDDMVVVGQLGQSLDGRVATPTGHSHYINGPAGLAHLHRLRALVDAVVIGIGTALADDPQLTVRRVSGPQPVRVVIDPAGRLPASARLLADDGVRRIVLTASGVRPPLPQGIEIVGLPKSGGQIAPSAILAALWPSAACAAS